MAKSVKVFEVLYHNHERPYAGAAGDGSFIERFRSESAAKSFSKGKTYYGGAATVSMVEVPRHIAARWGCA